MAAAQPDLCSQLSCKADAVESLLHASSLHEEHVLMASGFVDALAIGQTSREMEYNHLSDIGSIKKD